MHSTRLFIAASIIAASVLAGCKSQFDLLLEGNDSDAKYEAAFDYFNAGKYNKASQLFESLSVMTSGTERDDTVQYYLGLSNYRAKDYYTAETSFQNFMTNYPRSPFVENAAYLRIDCLYRQTYRYELDQTPTYTALSAISQYMTDFPNSAHMDVCDGMLNDLNERLDRKAYENAKLYYKMEDYKAARTALKNVLKDDADNIYREDILYYTAMSSYKLAYNSVPEKQKERYLTFLDDYLNFVGEYPDNEHRHEMDGLYRKAQKAIGRNVAETVEEPSAEKIEK